MSGEHLTHDMLQQYALEPAVCPPEAIAHLAECPLCRIEVTGYFRLKKALKDQPAPAFSFDLAAAVMERLEAGPGGVETPVEAVRGGVVTPVEVGRGGVETPVEAGPRRVLRLAVPFVIALVAVLPAWLFRKTAYFVFAEMSGAVAWIILAAAGVAVLFSIYKYYRKYQQVIQLIN